MSCRFSTGILHSHAPLMADVTAGRGGRGFSEPLSHVEGNRGGGGGRGGMGMEMRPTGDLTRLRADSEIKIWTTRDVDSPAVIE